MTRIASLIALILSCWAFNIALELQDQHSNRKKISAATCWFEWPDEFQGVYRDGPLMTSAPAYQWKARGGQCRVQDNPDLMKDLSLVYRLFGSGI